MEITGLGKQLTDKLTQNAQPKGVDSGPEAIQRFEHAMEGGNGMDQIRPPETGTTPAVANIGQAILNGMEKLRTTEMNSIKQITDRISGSDGIRSMSELLRTQIELARHGTEIELTTRIADRGNQGIQTLFRNQ